MGQFYLAILVARLVGLQMKSFDEPKHRLVACNS